VIRIEIGARHYLLYLVLPHPLKVALLSPRSRAALDRINAAVNEHVYSGAGAAEYDRLHRYGADEQHEYPAQHLVTAVWAPGGYGRALELGAGSGYFTALIARRAQRVLAVEPVPDMQRALRARCEAEGLANVELIGAPAAALAAHVAEGTVDSALVIQSLHHVHRRPEVFAALGRAVRPGGSLYLLEPHHNLRRVGRLVRSYLRQYRAPAFRGDERHWATHDFVTRGELQALCRHGGFEAPRLSGFWIPYTRRLIRDPARRAAVEQRLGRLPLLRHWAGVLALEARRAAPRGRG